jgi:hypothetical protein
LQSVVIIAAAFALTAAAVAISFEPTAFAQSSPGSKAPPPPPTSLPPRSSPTIREAPMATSRNNVFMAWPNNDTGHWNVFFAKSTDGGKTLRIMMISTPNKGQTINQNTEIAASGSNVYVTWWTNKTGTLMPVFRASNDNGNTFGKTIMLNSTG